MNLKKSALFLVFVVLLASCAQKRDNIQVSAEKQFMWTDELIKTGLNDACVSSSQWSSTNPDDVPSEYRSSTPIERIDTSSLTDFPTALVAGYCPHDAGAGYGNEFFFIGYKAELENKVFLIEKVLGDDSGLELNNHLSISNNKIVLELNGYSDANLCADCRDTTDVVEIQIIQNKPTVNYLSSNSYQIKAKINGVNQTESVETQESSAPQSSDSSSNAWPSESECLKVYAKEKDISDIKLEIGLLDELMWQYEIGTQAYNDYKKQIDFKNERLRKLESEYSNLLNDDTVFCSWKWDNPYS
jgi:hypothetical protein